ncbi:unnamed protein product [Trichobilharzia regenti]|nr:unnamed protein product [Trichobilharzia regenti]
MTIKCLRSVPSVKTKTTANFYSTEIKNDHNNQSPVNSWNEWDPLEEIIVGTPEYATVPRLLPEVKVTVKQCILNSHMTLKCFYISCYQ